MSILTDLTPATLTAAIEENLFSLFRAMGRMPGARLEETAEMIRYSTGLRSPMFNVRLGFREYCRISRFAGGL